MGNEEPASAKQASDRVGVGLPKTEGLRNSEPVGRYVSLPRALALGLEEKKNQNPAGWRGDRIHKAEA